MDRDTLYRLAEEYRDSSPIILIDHQVIRDNFERFRKALPRIDPYYAVKANPEPEIIRTLYKLGAGFDIASSAEYKLVDNNAMGTLQEVDRFMEERVIYANPVKPPKSLIRLEKANIQMTFDNFRELDKIRKYCLNPRLVLRVAVPNDGAIVELSSKFGADPDKATELLKYAKSLNLDVEGISFHVGSQCENFNGYVKAFEISRHIFDSAAALGFELDTLDIGGGYPANYNGKIINFEELAGVINSQINKHFADERIKIIAEPGRFLVANAATSIVQVMGKGIRGNRPYYYVNDGIYGTFSGQIFDHIQYHFKAFKDGPMTPSAVAGPTCDGLDTMVKDDMLPDVEIGEFLYSENVGAYTNASATHFNGFEPARIININIQ
jgi:ornithine decarboxylase